MGPAVSRLGNFNGMREVVVTINTFKGILVVIPKTCITQICGLIGQ